MTNLVRQKTTDSLNRSDISPTEISGAGIPELENPKIESPRPARVRPFLKWAGGKSSLLENIFTLFPAKWNTYHEPMLGGGAVFFGLNSHFGSLPSAARLADSNSELINVYRAIRDQPEELYKAIFSLPEFFSTHLKDKNVGELLSSDFFYKVRSIDREPNFLELPEIIRAARFIYLNKLCFNGLYRVNSKGQFNVPFGDYKNPTLADRSHLLSCSQCLAKVDLSVEDFGSFLEKPKSGDLVYLDPPYIPISQTSSFVSYTNESFKLEDHRRLFAAMRDLKSRGVYAIMSNSHTQYALAEAKGLDVQIIEARRSIASTSASRGKVKEIIVRNFS